MPQTIDPTITRICKLCGEVFHPTARKQYCCNQTKKRRCAVCGNEFSYVCNTSYIRETCSRACQVTLSTKRKHDAVSTMARKCAWCGKEFTPKSFRDAYCYDTHYKMCEVCGNQFEIDVRKDKSVKTCSEVCRYKLAVANRDIEVAQDSLRSSLIAKYGVDNPMRIPGAIDKIKSTNLKRYGVEWYTQTDEYKDRAAHTDMQIYGVTHHLKSSSVIEKRTDTVRRKYGSDNIFSSDYGRAKVKSSMIQKYGADNPSKVAEFKSKATRSARTSKLEQRICNLFDNYGIEYFHHHFLKAGDLSHEFDFYLPKYKLLLDADGLYYHSYLDDPDGVRVRDDYDEIRLKLVPADHIFHVIVESSEERQIKELVDVLTQIDGGLVSYDSYLFQWCRSTGFPYPNYSESRMIKDWSSLCKYYSDKYIPQCRIGQSIVQNYHRSIFNSNVLGNLSPVDAWNSDDHLKRAIINRFIYKNDVDPSKVLYGLYASKIGPKVSVFNPILARYLVLKYLSEFQEVFDPFSGFSGRLLGTASTGRRYIGQDLNIRAVAESNQIIKFLKLSEKCKVTCKDLIEDACSSYECLLTCPPYENKETYGSEVVFHSCDEWISMILSKYHCNRYVFVVDSTDTYKDSIVETIQTSSHLSASTEYIIVI